MTSALFMNKEQLVRGLDKFTAKNKYAFFDWKELLSHVNDQVNAYTLVSLFSMTKEAELLLELNLCRLHDEDIPGSSHPSSCPQDEATKIQAETSTKKTHLGAMTRSRAKHIQQEVNALLADSNIDMNENYILPKSCVLLLLRFLPMEIIQAYGEKCNEQDFINGVHCLRTSPYTPWVQWDEKELED